MKAPFLNSLVSRCLVLSFKTSKTKIFVRSQSLEICHDSLPKLKFAITASFNFISSSSTTIPKIFSSCVYSWILPNDFRLLLHKISCFLSAIPCVLLTVNFSNIRELLNDRTSSSLESCVCDASIACLAPNKIGSIAIITRMKYHSISYHFIETTSCIMHTSGMFFFICVKIVLSLFVR